MARKDCLRRDLRDCPYRDTEKYRCIREGKGSGFTEERASHYCQSTPCQFSLEQIFKELTTELKTLNMNNQCSGNIADETLNDISFKER